MLCAHIYRAISVFRIRLYIGIYTEPHGVHAIFFILVSLSLSLFLLAPHHNLPSSAYILPSSSPYVPTVRVIPTYKHTLSPSLSLSLSFAYTYYSCCVALSFSLLRISVHSGVLSRARGGGGSRLPFPRTL